MHAVEFNGDNLATGSEFQNFKNEILIYGFTSKYRFYIFKNVKCGVLVRQGQIICSTLKKTLSGATTPRMG